jgi:hypothetical protein
MTAMSHALLLRSTNATHDALTTRLETAIGHHPTLASPREHYPATDTFLASGSRHLAAIHAVLLPLARRRLPEGAHRAHEYAHQSKRLEVALAATKAKLYGSAYAVTRPWSEIWEEVRRELAATLELERELVADLSHHLGDAEHGELIDRLYRAEQRAPTRPHPYVPHLGIRGKLARGVCRRVDQFWDTTEGRMIPEPVRVHDRTHQGLMTQFLLGDPHLGEDE